MTQATGGTGFPLPGTGRATVAVPAPGPGEGRWVGAPSAALDPDGGFVVAYRVRVVDRRGAATVVARSADGEALTTVASLDKERFGAMSMYSRPVWRSAKVLRVPGTCRSMPSRLTLRRSISVRSSPNTLMPTGVRTPVVSMSMRVRIGGAMAIW